MAKSTQPDPIVNRPEVQNQYAYDPAKLKNADVNISKYWDDSSAQNYNNPELWWWQNQKYTWENTKNTEIAYNKDATVAWLDPNYLYGKEAQMKNSEEEGYIMRRNDNIASALYNEGKTSKQDVSDFLYWQKWFTNSEANERLNTIDSVYKRLGQIAPENEKKAEEEPKKENVSTNNPDMQLSDEGIKGWTLYWKVTADKGTPMNWITLEADKNAIQNTINMARQANFKNLQKMNSHDIAVSMAYWTDPYGSQAMADLATFDPQKYQEVQAELKAIQSMMDVNNIAQGNGVNKEEQTTASIETINNDADRWVDKTASGDEKEALKESLQIAMNSNATAQSATQEMLNINKDIAEIQEKMNKLPQEAKKYFKGDVPQYIVDAFVANRNAQYQSELNKLQSRYNSAVDLYKTELSNEQWKAEMNLKQMQLQADLNAQAWDQAYKAKQFEWSKNMDIQNINLKKVQWFQGKAYQVNADGTVSQLTSVPGKSQMDLLRDQVSTTTQMYFSNIEDGQLIWSCEHATNLWNQALYWEWVRMEWVKGYTNAEEKRNYVNTAAELPGIWMTAVFTWEPGTAPSINSALYGHTMMVTWYDPETGMLTLTWSNKSSKASEKNRVYTETKTVAQWKAWWLQGYWDPLLDMQLEGADGGFESDFYNAANTPMLDIFDELYASDLNADQKKSLSQWESMYNILYQMKETNLIDALVNSSWWEKVMADLSKKKFTDDENWSAFFEALTTSIRNNIAGDEATIAVNKFQVLVKDLLRFESGAAISGTEWRSYFQLYMPQAGESEAVQKSKLDNWDAEVYKLLRSAWVKHQQYVPIFQNYTATTPETNANPWNS